MGGAILIAMKSRREALAGREGAVTKAWEVSAKN
jgi:hypothetical protein